MNVKYNSTNSHPGRSALNVLVLSREYSPMVRFREGTALIGLMGVEIHVDMYYVELLKYMRVPRHYYGLQRRK